MLSRIKQWMERFLEDPFYRAELMRAEILKEENDLMSTLVGSLNHNFETIRSWSK